MLATPTRVRDILTRGQPSASRGPPRRVPFHADLGSAIEESPLDLGDIQLEVVPTPGHSPDSICFYSSKDRYLICGDVIFHQNTGRVDLPGGDATKLKRSIEELAKLDLDYLLPGHMATIASAAAVHQNFEFIRQHVFRWL